MLSKINAFIDGKKFYLIGLGLVVLAGLKVVFDIPFIDNIELFDVTEPSDLFALGVLTIAGRSTIAKVIQAKETPK